MAFLEDDSPLDIPLGQILRIPCKFIKGKAEVHPLLLKAIAQELKTKGKNVLPVIIKYLDEDKYQALLNAHVLEAARQAKMDFVWCIVVNDELELQVQIELGQVLQVNIATAPVQEIAQVLEYIQSQMLDFKKINPSKIAEAIVDYRKTKPLTNLSFLTKLKCGVGKAKVAPLSKFLMIS